MSNGEFEDIFRSWLLMIPFDVFNLSSFSIRYLSETLRKSYILGT